MHLFVSDIHLGRGTPAETRAAETALVACLRAHEADVDGLYLLGDVFEEYIEYSTLVPKGGVRLLGLLAKWADAGVPITYLAGNHDPWHLDYFADELGIRVLPDDLIEPIGGMLVYLTHGDGRTSVTPLYNRLKPLLRHSVPTWLYRTLLPADAGLRLARWVNRTVSNDEINYDQVQHLEAFAREMLVRHTADAVVLGHTHQHTLRLWPEGCYLNTGFWYEARTFGRLDDDGLALCRWTDAGTEVVSRGWAVSSTPA